MSELDWNPQDFLECLVEVPEIEDFGAAYLYTTTRDDTVLELVIWPFESIVNLSLTAEGQNKPLIEYTLAVRGPILYKTEKWGESLVFKSCVVVPGRFYYIRDDGWKDVFNEGKHPGQMNMALSVYPNLSIRFLDTPA